MSFIWFGQMGILIRSRYRSNNSRINMFHQMQVTILYSPFITFTFILFAITVTKQYNKNQKIARRTMFDNCDRKLRRDGSLGHRVMQSPVFVIFCSAGLYSCSFCWRFFYLFGWRKYLVYSVCTTYFKLIPYCVSAWYCHAFKSPLKSCADL